MLEYPNEYFHVNIEAKYKTETKDTINKNGTTTNFRNGTDLDKTGSAKRLSSMLWLKEYSGAGVKDFS